VGGLSREKGQNREFQAKVRRIGKEKVGKPLRYQAIALPKKDPRKGKTVQRAPERIERDVSIQLKILSGGGSPPWEKKFVAEAFLGENGGASERISPLPPRGCKKAWESAKGGGL